MSQTLQKGYKTMQLIRSLASELYTISVPGCPIEAIRGDIIAMNDRVESVLKKMHYDPDKVPTASLYSKGEDQRMAEIESLKALCESNDVLYLPFLYQAGEDYIAKRARNDLTFFATGFSGQRGLRFILSTSSLGVPSSCSFKPETERARVGNVLKSMHEQGYVFIDKGRRIALSDCDTNRNLLRKYCKGQLNAVVTEILTYTDTVREIRGFVPLDSLLTSIQDDGPLLPDKPQALLTADSAITLKRELKHLMDCVSTYSMAKDDGWPDLILSNCESAMYTIEAITGVYGSIYMRENAVHAPIREKNRAIHQAKAQVQSEASAKIGKIATKLYEKVYSAAQNFAASFDMFASTVEFLPHQRFQIELVPDNMESTQTPAVRDAKTPSVPEMTALLTSLKVELPSASIQEYRACANSGMSFNTRGITIALDDMRDLVTLLHLYGKQTKL